jgi:hypothetical protein
MSDPASFLKIASLVLGALVAALLAVHRLSGCSDVAKDRIILLALLVGLLLFGAQVLLLFAVPC